MQRRLWLTAQRLALLAFMLLAWQVASGKLVDPFFISSPSRVYSDLKRGFGDGGSLANDTIVTLTEAGIGLVTGMVSGVLVGLVFSFWRRLALLLEPFMAVLNALPRPALAPLAVLWFGLGMTSKVFIAWSLVFFVAFYNTIEGVRSIERETINAIRVMRPSRWQLMRLVILPAVLAWVFAAFRVSVSLALIGAIVAEFVGATAGLGYQLTTAQGLLDTDRVFSVFVLTGALAAILLALAHMVEETVLKWRPKPELGL
ncbi:MAG: ABC transporter permease [Solirubrobacterales bacterium]|nr:ABC transporter permease [Solirubrobacterales bacterium]